VPCNVDADLRYLTSNVRNRIPTLRCASHNALLDLMRIVAVLSSSAGTHPLDLASLTQSPSQPRCWTPSTTHADSGSPSPRRLIIEWCLSLRQGTCLELKKQSLSGTYSTGAVRPPASMYVHNLLFSMKMAPTSPPIIPNITWDFHHR
jgi:hypothetical protein